MKAIVWSGVSNLQGAILPTPSHLVCISLDNTVGGTYVDMLSVSVLGNEENCPLFESLMVVEPSSRLSTIRVFSSSGQESTSNIFLPLNTHSTRQSRCMFLHTFVL